MSLFNFLRSSHGLEEALGQNPVLLDVRTEAEFTTGSVPGSINIPLHQLSSRLNEIKKLDRTVVAFCRSGMRSGQAKDFLNSKGIKCLNGGSWNNVAAMLSN